MIPDEILFRLLQFSTATGTIALLITCMSMHDVKWWLPIPIYLLAVMCMVTFLTTFFIRRFTFDVAVVTLFTLAISSVTTAVHSYIKPLPENKREALNRRVLFWTLPIIGLLLTVWCFGVAYEGGMGFFHRFEQKMNKTLDNQAQMIVRQDSTDKKVASLQGQNKVSDSAAVAYRNKLDRKMSDFEMQMYNFSLRLHRLQTDQQKQR